MDRETLINKVFESKYLGSFSRSKSFIYRQQHYPEVIITVDKFWEGELYIHICLVTSDFVTIEDVTAIDLYTTYFIELFGIDQSFTNIYVVQNIEELDFCRGVIGEFPDFHFVFYGNYEQKIFFNREVYEH